MDFHSRAVLTLVGSSFHLVMKYPLDRANLSRNVSPPSEASSFPKCPYICCRIYPSSARLPQTRYNGIPWTLSYTTSPGTTNLDTKATRWWSSWWMCTQIFLGPRTSYGDIGRGELCEWTRKPDSNLLRVRIPELLFVCETLTFSCNLSIYGAVVASFHDVL